MNQQLLLVGLPYASIAVFAAGLAWRYRRRSTVTSLSSQILEHKWLVWGSVPFHFGIGILLVGHLIPVIAPSWWQTYVSDRNTLLIAETIGAAAGFLCLAGLLVLFVRRVTSPSLRSGTTLADVFVLLILIAQVALGLGVATMYRWGAVWSARTTTPYLLSLVTLQPDPSLVAGVPFLVTLHLAGAWIVLALIPFTRIVHMFALPLRYLARPPQKVIWLRR